MLKHLQAALTLLAVRQLNTKNLSRYPSLDKLTEDPRVVQIWDEGEDGIFVELADEWEWDGLTVIHEYNVKNVYQRMSELEPRTPEAQQSREELLALMDTFDAVNNAPKAAINLLGTIEQLDFGLDKPPWEMTLEEFYKPYAAPKGGYRTLYHATNPDYLQSIVTQGLRTTAATGYEAPKGALWAAFEPTGYSNEGALVEFQVPENDGRVEQVNKFHCMIYRDILPDEITNVYSSWTIPFFSSRNPSKWDGTVMAIKRSDLMRTTTSKWHRFYVEFAVANDYPVPSEVLAEYPDLKKAPSAENEERGDAPHVESALKLVLDHESINTALSPHI
jgi:hypothetical protein